MQSAASTSGRTSSNSHPPISRCSYRTCSPAWDWRRNRRVPSRDGGVDCVAYDTRPIFGGKVVIQAKRYKNTVGVSAVRVPIRHTPERKARRRESW